MTKEKILSDLQNLVLTLKSPNIKDINVKSKFDKQVVLFNESLSGLSKEDWAWLDVEYRSWFKGKFGELVSKNVFVDDEIFL